jgi:ankyrin repeat protein
VFKALIRAGASIETRDSKGMTPLMYAAKKIYYSKVITTFIEESADVNAKDVNGMTPLMHAAKANFELAIRELLRAGADPKVKDNNSKMAIDHAREHGSKSNEAVSILKRVSR